MDAILPIYGRIVFMLGDPLLDDLRVLTFRRLVRARGSLVDIGRCVSSSRYNVGRLVARLFCLIVLLDPCRIIQLLLVFV